VCGGVCVCVKGGWGARRALPNALPCQASVRLRQDCRHPACITHSQNSPPSQPLVSRQPLRPTSVIHLRPGVTVWASATTGKGEGEGEGDAAVVWTGAWVGRAFLRRACDTLRREPPTPRRRPGLARGEKHLQPPHLAPPPAEGTPAAPRAACRQPSMTACLLVMAEPLQPASTRMAVQDGHA
jgi:hypothetical protein